MPTSEQAKAAETPKKKKRGFWSRVFGKDKDQKDEAKPPEDKPQRH